MFKLAVISDEISQDLDVVIRFAQDNLLQGVELRSVWEKGPFQWEEADVRAMKEKLDAAGLAVCGIGAPFFKCDRADRAEVAEHIESLRRLCKKIPQILLNKSNRTVRGQSCFLSEFPCSFENRVSDQPDQRLDQRQKQAIQHVQARREGQRQRPGIYASHQHQHKKAASVLFGQMPHGKQQDLGRDQG